MLTFSPQLLVQTLIVTFALMTGSQAFAASDCKGQKNTACIQKNSCYWVAGYKRSDGANVKSHCRSKPKSSLKSSAGKTTKQLSTVKKPSAGSVKKTQDSTSMVPKKSLDKTSSKKQKDVVKKKAKKSDKKVTKELSKKAKKSSDKKDTKKQTKKLSSTQ
jgi:hypothetical protein